jgi:hypothetical protein
MAKAWTDEKTDRAGNPSGRMSSMVGVPASWGMGTRVGDTGIHIAKGFIFVQIILPQKHHTFIFQDCSIRAMRGHRSAVTGHGELESK